jgi:hypothetical protein
VEVIFASKNLLVSDNGKRIGIGAVSVRPGARYTLANLCLSKTSDQSNRKTVAAMATPRPADFAGNPYLFDWTLVYSERVPIDTYFSIAIYSAGIRGLFDALHSATFPLVVNGVTLANDQELYQILMTASFVDSAPQTTILFSDPADAFLFRKNLRCLATFATVDNLQTSLTVPIIPDRDLLLIVPEVMPREAAIASQAFAGCMGNTQQVQTCYYVLLNNMLLDFDAQGPIPAFEIKNVSGVVNFNLIEKSKNSQESLS